LADFVLNFSSILIFGLLKNQIGRENLKKDVKIDGILGISNSPQFKNML
jgi:hypothetical protein